MKKIERYALITALIRKLRCKGSWCGETHVQKATYLAQFLLGVPFAFEFVLYKHGPYSFDLSSELTAMRADEILKLEPQLYPYRPTLSPTETAEEIETRFAELVGKYAPQLDFVGTIFGNKGVAELECLSTAYYVTRKLGNQVPLDQRAQHLHELKPHISLREALTALRATDEMVDRSLSVPPA